MDSIAKSSLVAAIHHAPIKIALVAAGAGSEAVSDLLSVPGASNTLIEAHIPYSRASFVNYLAQTPKQHVSRTTGRMLAGRAYTRGKQLLPNDPHVVGISCTATLVTTREKRGEHRAHLAAWRPGRVISYSLHLEKGARTRQEEETAVSTLLLNLMAEMAGLEERLSVPLLAGDLLTRKESNVAEAISQLYLGDHAFVGVYASGMIRTANINPELLLSGSFNPLHEGHVALAEAAADLLEKPVAFEITAVNADKPAIDEATLLSRLSQFAGRFPVYASSAPTYLEKARLFPNTTFIVGFDTAVRILEPRFYGFSREKMWAALAEIDRLNGRFLVAGRVGQDDDFHTVQELQLPPQFKHLFRGIPPKQFRRDISSTSLREKGLVGTR